MRVDDSVASQARPERAAARRFAETLQRASANEAGRRGTAAGAAGMSEKRWAMSARAQELGVRLAVDREEERVAAAGSDPARAGVAPDGSPVPELASLVRTLPAAIEAARAKDGATLALSFGRSLDVELRSGAAGVELLLRPDSRLLRAAEAELPRVVAALRLQGVSVARAEVRGRGDGARRAR